MLLQPSGPGIRRDSGMYEGWNVPMDYDPLLAKLIGYGTDRQQAIMRLERALYEYFVAGIKTNISLFQRILGDADFRAGKLDTGYLDRLLAKSNPGRRVGAQRSRRSKRWRRSPRLPPECLPCSIQLRPPARMGTPAELAPVPSNWKQKGRSEALR